jgi:non-ribosomal peptide synthetase component F
MIRETITAGFAGQVAATPGNLAVLADDGVATYRELAANATAVAALLRETGGTGRSGCSAGTASP